MGMESHESDLWTRLRAGDALARDALVMRHAPWSRLVARDVFVRIRGYAISWQDCTQNAMVGLLESVDRYEPGRGVAFRTFARQRVRGAVFNGLRSLRDAGADDRSVERMSDRRDSLQAGEAEDPFEAFVGMAVGLGLGFLLDALPEAELDATPVEAYAAQERARILDGLNGHLAALAERERMIVTLHYFHFLPFVDIAARMDISKGRVSQLHRRALESLRASLASARITMVF
jgi:RNA polymerase sigma factor for flagellar operon FliA